VPSTFPDPYRFDKPLPINAVSSACRPEQSWGIIDRLISQTQDIRLFRLCLLRIGLFPMLDTFFDLHDRFFQFLPLTFVRQVTQGVGHECHESIDDANYDGRSCYVPEKAKER
jgi:hypothetical protein